MVMPILGTAVAKLAQRFVTFEISTGRPKRSLVVVIRIKHVNPAKGRNHLQKESRARTVVCVVLVTLSCVIPSRAEILSTPTKLSLSPLPAPTATVIDTNQFSLAIEPRPKSEPATNGVSAGSSDAIRRVLEAAAVLKKQRVRAKGSRTGLFSTQVGERGFGIAGIQAGYGMVFMDPVFTRGRNGTAMEEPSYIVVKTSLKF
jgi:hypothetical protein